MLAQKVSPTLVASSGPSLQLDTYLIQTGSDKRLWQRMTQGFQADDDKTHEGPIQAHSVGIGQMLPKTFKKTENQLPAVEWTDELDRKHSSNIIQGPIINPDGQIYTGQVSKNAKPEGRGILLSQPKGVFAFIYEGYFELGLPHHLGRFMFSNGDIYVGDVTAGVMSGEGLYINSQAGSRYEGTFRTNLPHGVGVEQWNDGTIYKGAFIQGQMHGRGALTSNRHSYNGEFAYGLFDGQGTFEVPDGTRFIGKWIKSILQSPATVEFMGGARYFGDIDDNLKPNGQGTLECNHRKVMGKFKNGQIDGDALVTLTNVGEQKDAIFSNGNFKSWKQARIRRNSAVQIVDISPTITPQGPAPAAPVQTAVVQEIPVPRIEANSTKKVLPAEESHKKKGMFLCCC